MWKLKLFFVFSLIVLGCHGSLLAQKKIMNFYVGLDGNVVLHNGTSLTEPDGDFVMKLPADKNSSIAVGSAGTVCLIEDSVLTIYSQEFGTNRVRLPFTGRKVHFSNDSTLVVYAVDEASEGEITRAIIRLVGDNISLTYVSEPVIDMVSDSYGRTYCSSENKIFLLTEKDGLLPLLKIPTPIHSIAAGNCGELYYTTSQGLFSVAYNDSVIMIGPETGKIRICDEHLLANSGDSSDIVVYKGISEKSEARRLTSLLTSEARLYIEQDKLWQAQEILFSALKINPRMRDALGLLSEVYERTGHSELAKFYTAKAY